MRQILKNFGRKYWLGLLITLLLGWAAFLRFWTLRDQPYWMDEGFTVNAILAVIHRGKTILDSGEFYSCPTYCYPAAWIANTFGQNAFSYRFLAALAGAIFIPVFFFTIRSILRKKPRPDQDEIEELSFRAFDGEKSPATKKFFGLFLAGRPTIIALLATFFIAFSYWQIAWSREARWYTLLELFSWLSVFFFWKFLARWFQQESPQGGEAIHRRLSLLSFSLGFLILAISTHAEAYLLIPIFAAWFCFKFFKTGQAKIQSKILLAILILLLSTTSIFLIDKYSGHHFIMPLLQDLKIHYLLPYYLSFYLKHYWLFILPTIWLFLNLKNNHHRPQLVYLLSCVLAYFFAFGLFTDLLAYRYLFLITPALILTGSYGIILLAEKFRYIYQKAAFFGVVIIIFFATGQGVLWPKAFYFLESDTKAASSNRPVYAYTPQPDWNTAYAFIKENRQPGDLVISSNPVFTKIFLNEPGYWLEYPYLGIGDKCNYQTPDGREYYVGAKVIHSREDLAGLIRENNGYIIIDHYSKSGRLAPEIIKLIDENTKAIFYNEKDYKSKIWIYKF